MLINWLDLQAAALKDWLKYRKQTAFTFKPDLFFGSFTFCKDQLERIRLLPTTENNQLIPVEYFMIASYTTEVGIIGGKLLEDASLATVTDGFPIDTR